jgi:hypothetical protein
MPTTSTGVVLEVVAAAGIAMDLGGSSQARIAM